MDYRRFIYLLFFCLYALVEVKGQNGVTYWIQDKDEVPNCVYGECYNKDINIDTRIFSSCDPITGTPITFKIKFRVSDTEFGFSGAFEDYPTDNNQTIVVKPGTWVEVWYDKSDGRNKEDDSRLTFFELTRSNTHCGKYKEIPSTTIPDNVVDDVFINKKYKFQVGEGGTYTYFANVSYQLGRLNCSERYETKASFCVPYVDGPQINLSKKCRYNPAELTFCNTGYYDDIAIRRVKQKTGATGNPEYGIDNSLADLGTWSVSTDGNLWTTDVPIAQWATYEFDVSYFPPWDLVNPIVGTRSLTITPLDPIPTPTLAFEYPLDKCYGHSIKVKDETLGKTLYAWDIPNYDENIETKFIYSTFWVTEENQSIELLDSNLPSEYMPPKSTVEREFENVGDKSFTLRVRYVYQKEDNTTVCPAEVQYYHYEKEIKHITPDVDFSYQQDECLGYGVSFTNETEGIGAAYDLTYLWDFGDPTATPTTSELESPTCTYTVNGVKPVELTVYFKDPRCISTAENSIIKEVTIEDITEELHSASFDIYEFTDDHQVLATSATTFDDNWLLSSNSTKINQGHAIDAGLSGVWRPNASYAYLSDRNQVKNATSTLNIAQQGGFTPKVFNWKMNATDELFIPDWVKATQMTIYSQFGYELENKDALDRYSSALYGYADQLPIAVGANVSYYEMAYTGFEEPSTGNFQFPVNTPDLDEDNQPILRDVFQEKLMTIKVLGGNEDLVILDMPFAEFDNFNPTKLGIVKGVPLRDATASFTINQVFIDCKHEYVINGGTPSEVSDPEKSMAILGGIGYEGIEGWTGEVGFYEDITVTSATTAEIVNTEAHTGKNSLQVSGTEKFYQPQMELEEGKKYVVSAWVKVNTGGQPATYQSTNTATEKLGISVGWQDDAANTATTVLFEPKGIIIEGWQRIEGVFEFSNDNEDPFHILFQRGDGNTEIFIDDLRFFPADANMQSYVYDPENYRLKATLDNNNFATLYSYDEEGNLYLVKKETVRGIKTIQESISYQKELNE